jgi:hypothetical protein
MLNTLLLATQLVCPPPPQCRPYSCYYWQPMPLHWPTPDSLKPPPFIARPANMPDRKTPAANVTVPPSVYEGVRSLTIENPFYQPSK